VSDLTITGGSSDLHIAEGLVASEAAPGAPTLDASGLRLVPGFVDLQCNGAIGIDLSTEPERLWEVAEALPRWGVTAWLPTIITGPPNIRHRALAALRAGALDDRPRAAPLGLHLEGPFLDRDRRGAHPSEHLATPDPRIVAAEAWPGAVALVTLAPELPGALDVVRALVAEGIVASAGHSSATASEARAGIDAGITYVTHLFNAMAPLHHREPGLAGVALTDDRVRAGIIADGLHVHPMILALAAGALGDRLTLVTDAVAALGAPPGKLNVGSQQAEATGDVVRLRDGTLAGSTLSMDEAIRNLTSVPPDAALRAATSTPAAVVSDRSRGTLTPGARGDAVLLDREGQVAATVIAGRVAWESPCRR
jgi:N-acetylglucosamine-6-phosphate deacetylase